MLISLNIFLTHTRTLYLNIFCWSNCKWKAFAITFKNELIIHTNVSCVHTTRTHLQDLIMIDDQMNQPAGQSSSELFIKRHHNIHKFLQLFLVTIIVTFSQRHNFIYTHTIISEWVNTVRWDSTPLALRSSEIAYDLHWKKIIFLLSSSSSSAEATYFIFYTGVISQWSGRETR